MPTAPDAVSPAVPETAHTAPSHPDMGLAAGTMVVNGLGACVRRSSFLWGAHAIGGVQQRSSFARACRRLHRQPMCSQAGRAPPWTAAAAGWRPARGGRRDTVRGPNPRWADRHRTGKEPSRQTNWSRPETRQPRASHCPKSSAAAPEPGPPERTLRWQAASWTLFLREQRCKPTCRGWRCDNLPPRLEIDRPSWILSRRLMIASTRQTGAAEVRRGEHDDQSDDGPHNPLRGEPLQGGAGRERPADQTPRQPLAADCANPRIHIWPE